MPSISASPSETASVAPVTQALILAGALPGEGWILAVGLVSLWGAAVLTLMTGWDYLRVGLKHMD